MNAIEVIHASKIYRRYNRRRQFATLKSALLSRSLVRDLEPDETFSAVQDVTFTLPAGRTLGVIGRNGSGKSTMLKLVAGITKPTSGTVTVNGRISALIELGAGFHPEISGRENVFINGIMLGLTKKEITRRFDEIVEFAELEEFIDAPVKTYSSGMYMRLGFAVAIHVDPDVLLVDEVLAVGDEGFTHKCLDKFAEFKRRGKTILLVTHSLGLVERFCDEALWLDGGRLKGLGDPRRVVGAYVTDVEAAEETQLAAADAKAQESAVIVSPDEPATALLPDHPIETAEAPADMFRATEGRWGSREVEITDVLLTAADGERGHVFHSGEPLDIRMRAARAAGDRRLRDRHRDLQRGGRLLLRHQHEPRGSQGRAHLRRRGGDVQDRQPRSRRGDLQARRGHPQGRRLSLRLPPPPLHLPREVADQGRRHLSAAPRLAFLGRAHVRPRRRADVKVERGGLARLLSTDEAVALVRRCAATDGRSCSPTASSTCSIRATSDTCRVPARSAMP